MTTQTVRIDDVVIRNRQRKDIAAGPLNELKESILNRNTGGLLHAPVAWLDAATQKWVLTVGERRLSAIKKIAEEKKSFWHSGIEYAAGTLPVTPLPDYVSEIGRFEAELAENIFRVDLEWQDRMKAIADLHAMRVRQNPKHTKTDTAQELIDAGVSKVDGTKKSGFLANAVSNAVIIAEHLGNEKIASARNAAEALQLIYRQEEEAALAALAKRGLALAKSPPLIEVRNGDLLSALPALEDATFDLICADPPYGLGAGGAGFRARTAVHHNYADDVGTARAVAQCILTEGFRLTRPRANLFMFCDIELFDWLKATAANMGWTPFRRPLIWQKSDSEGLAPWGGSGPRITTEFIFFATKGQRGLNASPTDVFRVNRVPRNERIHAAEKPVELMAALIQCASLPGERLLDPCCGSGSSLVAARTLGRRALGIEKDSDYFNAAMANVHMKAQPDAKA